MGLPLRLLSCWAFFLASCFSSSTIETPRAVVSALVLNPPVVRRVWIGGILAARLARTGHTVSAIARGAHLEAIRANGLTLRDRTGTFTAEVTASNRAADLGAAIARIPRMGRFVTAFGAATVDPDLPVLQSSQWPSLDWDRIGEAIGAPAASLHHLVSPDPIPDGPTWARSGQAAQAELLRTTIEILRRLKYRPTGGFFAFYLADPSPAGGFGILDHDRRAKPAWQTVEAACAPVIVVADPFPDNLAGGAHVEVAVHVVSDLHTSLADARLTATVHHPDGSTQTHSYRGAVGADTVEHIANLSIIVRGAGDLALTLELTADNSDGSVTATNRYHTTVA